MKVVATAPAKLILVGEYAVVEGAPALVAAVNRRVRVALEERDGEGWAYRTSAEGGVERTLTLDVDGRLVDAAGHLARDDPAVRLLAVALEAAREATDAPLPRGLAVQIESGALFADGDGQKLGLGSSAAVMVALGAALRRLGVARGAAASPGDAWQLDLEAHRRLQGGRGSGADVAASHHGGVIRFQRGADSTIRCRSVEVPADLHMRCFWTGRSASTADFLAKAAACRMRAPEDWEAHMTRLTAVATQAANAFEKANTRAFLAACAQYAEGLQGLGETLEAPIVSGPHRRLSVLAHASGAVYKPSGAGGGDIGVAFGDDPDGLDRMARSAAEAGFPTLTIDVDPLGVEVLER